MMKRIFAIVLSCVLLSALFAGCSETKDPEETKGGTSASGDATYTDIDVSKLNFGGRTVTIGSAWINDWQPEQKDGEYASEFDKKWAEVYKSIEDALNIKFEFKSGFFSMTQDILPIILSGNTPCDICDMKTHTWIPCAANNLLVPMDDSQVVAGGLDHTDPTKFFQPFTQAMKLDGHVYGVRWNGTFDVCEFGWCIYFNKQYVNEAGVSDLYKVVRDGKWTWDYYLNLAQKMTRDTDQDGVPDVYGNGTFAYGSEVFTNGGYIVSQDSSGKYVVTLNDPRCISALQFTHTLCNNGTTSPLEYGAVHRAFNEGKVAMVWGEQWNTSAGDLGFKETAIEYGLVPMPKGPDIDHYVNVLGGVRCNCIFACNENIKDVATILAVMGQYFTNDGWSEYYCSEELQGDEDALDMVLNYIWPNTVVDYSWCDWDTVCSKLFRENIYLPITKGEGTPMQKVEAGLAQFQAGIDEILNKG